ncbi:MAG: ABC transporter substrate-binding protein [Alphaproteobacteria bacterium]
MGLKRALGTAVGIALITAVPLGSAMAQKAGGIMRAQQFSNPPSASIHEEATVATAVPFMAVFNNLVLFDQHIEQNSEETIRPDLATEWSWNDDGTKLTFKLRDGVTWHDGKPFTAEDVKCTFDMLTETSETQKLRRNPRGAWYGNIEKMSTNGDNEVTFELKRPQPSLLMLLASGYTPIYPCHVSPADMRVNPIGTGPFKFVHFRQNESIKLEKNENYWREGRPYLDGIEYAIIASQSTRMLSFVAGNEDITFPTDVSVPLMKDVLAQSPNAQCKLRPSNVSTNLIINSDAPPFDDPEMRRALALTLDREAFNDILNEGKATISGTMLPPPAGVWGLPPEKVKELVGFGDVEANRAEARKIMESKGFGPNNRMKLKVITRNIPTFRNPAVIFLDQLSHIYIDAELEIIESAVYYNTVFQKRYSVGMNQTGSAVDDPDQHFYENYACGSLRNYTAYCDKEMEKRFEEQSMETDFEKRRELVWAIDRDLQNEIVRPIIFHGVAGGCMHPHVKGITLMINSIYNGWRYEDVWLDK